jgi:hypothetical protein
MVVNGKEIVGGYMRAKQTIHPIILITLMVLGANITSISKSYATDRENCIEVLDSIGVFGSSRLCEDDDYRYSTSQYFYRSCVQALRSFNIEDPARQCTRGLLRDVASSHAFGECFLRLHYMEEESRLVHCGDSFSRRLVLSQYSGEHYEACYNYVRERERLELIEGVHVYHGCLNDPLKIEEAQRIARGPDSSFSCSVGAAGGNPNSGSTSLLVEFVTDILNFI